MTHSYLEMVKRNVVITSRPSCVCPFSQWMAYAIMSETAPTCLPKRERMPPGLGDAITQHHAYYSASLGCRSRWFWFGYWDSQVQSGAPIRAPSSSRFEGHTRPYISCMIPASPNRTMKSGSREGQRVACLVGRNTSCRESDESCRVSPQRWRDSTRRPGSAVVSLSE